jgi:hypothetical protein
MTLNVYVTTILDNIVACATPKTVALLRQYLYACTRSTFYVSIYTLSLFGGSRMLDNLVACAPPKTGNNQATVLALLVPKCKH